MLYVFLIRMQMRQEMPGDGTEEQQRRPEGADRVNTAACSRACTKGFEFLT